MKRIFASSIVILMCILPQAFAADQEFDQQIIMNVPPTEELHVVTKGYVDEIVDEAEFPITEVVAPLYWKDPITGGTSQSRYLSSITISPGSAAGTIQYSVDGGAPIVVAVPGFTPAGAEVERLKMEVAHLRGQMEALAAALIDNDEMELAQTE